MKASLKPLPPGSVIGILGGGQLGRMLALAAARLGLTCHIYAPAGDNPAFAVAAAATEGAWEDEAALARFARACDVVTYEFENVPAAAIAAIAGQCPAFPPARALEVSQDRLSEKRFLNGLGIATAPFCAADTPEALAREATRVGFPGLLKTRRLGYDGKGQARIASALDLEAGWTALGGADLVYEGFVPFAREVSVIAARGRDGHTAAYDIGENVHRAGILRSTTVPAAIREETAREARRTAFLMLEALDYVGVIGVEMFLLEEAGRERLLVNEFAPRVHNSGHWTIDGCACSQFEQHVRAVAGWPLGDPARHSDAVMENLIGAEVEGWQARAPSPGECLHIYGKAEVRPGRKMGHVTRIRAKT
jgi:5-(carboxyamino)imidazole ribonucleotide synthase